MDSEVKNRRLRNGVEIPEIGFGTWRTPDDDSGVEAVCQAIAAGYRHIDTAARYENETAVGRGVRRAAEQSGLRREDIFITSKVWNTERGYDKTMAAFEASMQRLGLEYLDLYLVHWPAVSAQFDNWEELNRDTWRAMTEIYRSGRARAIGVSNFKPAHLRALMDAEIVPMVDQIEYHPGFCQEETLRFCRENGILNEGWSPLGRGNMLQNETIVRLAGKYGRTAAQICLRFALQSDVVPLPKSVHEERIRQNLGVYDFAISPEDMELIRSMPVCGYSGQDPDTVSF